MLSVYFCRQDYKIIMVNTRNNRISARLVPIRKNDASSYSQKYFPVNLWCHNCSDSSNLGFRTKTKSYLKPSVINLNGCSRNQTKHFYLIDNYKEKRLLNFIDNSPKNQKLLMNIKFQ